MMPDTNAITTCDGGASEPTLRRINQPEPNALTISAIHMPLGVTPNKTSAGNIIARKIGVAGNVQRESVSE